MALQGFAPGTPTAYIPYNPQTGMGGVSVYNPGNLSQAQLDQQYAGGMQANSAAQAPPDPTAQGLGTLTSLGGAGLGMYDASQRYAALQDALKTIGPTSLQGWNMNGPGGGSYGYDPKTGQANMNLGSLNPAFSGFAGAAGAGSSGYNAGLPYGLANNASQFLPAAGSQLAGAYGNYNAGMGAANQQLGNLGNFNTNYNNLLSGMRAQMAPQVQQQAYGLQNTLFGNGVADSAGAASGALAAQNFGRGVGQADANAQLNAFQMAQQQQNSAASNYGALTNSANGILANAFQNFGGTNQLISGLNTAGLNNAGTAAQGAGALNAVGLNNYNAALQSGVSQGQVRNMSLFPYAQTALGLSNTPGGMSTGANALSQIGSSLLGPNGFGGTNPISSLYGLGKSAYNWMTGNGPQWGGPSPNDLAGYTGPDQFAANPSTFANPDIGSQIGDWTGSGFPSAGGQAANDITIAANSVADPAAAAAMPALGATDLASSAGLGGDAALNATLQSAADQGIASMSIDAGASAGSSLSSMAAAAGPAAAAAALFAVPGMIFDKQSQFTPGQQYADFQGQLSRMTPGSAGYNQILGLMQGFNPQTQSFSSNLFAGQGGGGTRYGTNFSRNLV